MSQKLVLSVEDEKIQLQDLTEFVNRCIQLKFQPRAEIAVEHHSSEGKIYFTVAIPEPVTKTKTTNVQKQVVKQIEEHKEALAAGEEVPGHVPAIIKTPVVKKRCPLCNGIKPLTRNGYFKSHMSNGKKCLGSGKDPKKAANKPPPSIRKVVPVRSDVDPENTADNSPMPETVRNALAIKRTTRRAKS